MKREFLNTVGKRIRWLRQGLEMNQGDLSYALKGVGVEIGSSYVSELERSNRIPSGEVLAGLAKVLGCTTDYLLMLTDESDISSSEINKAKGNELDIGNGTDLVMLQRLIDVFSALHPTDQLRIVDLATRLRTMSEPRTIGNEKGIQAA